MYNTTFRAFLNEAQFTKELLGIGVTQLYKANYSKKGIYYQAFTCLSTGIERMEKLCLILDYYIFSNATLPQENYIRKHGHNIFDLFKACNEIAENQHINFRFPCDLSDDIHQSALQVLSNFAQSSGRYSNINILVGKNQEQDCMSQWYTNVDLKIFDKHISESKKQGINERANYIGLMMQSFAVVRHTTEINTELTDPAEASKRTGIWEAVAPYRQLYMLQIIRFLTQLLVSLGHKAMSLNPEDIPYFSEVFALFYNDNAYFRSRKTWDNI